MKKLLVVLAAVAVMLSVTACTSFKMSGLQVTMDAPAYTTVSEFDISVPVVKLLGNSAGVTLANFKSEATDATIYDAIRAEIEANGGDAAVNIVIDYKAEVIDIVLNSVTGSIYAPAHAHVTGTIVKY